MKEKAKEEWAKIRSLAWKQRLEYLWDYYKFVLVGFIIFGVVVFMGVDIYKKNQEVTGLHAMVINSDMMAEGDVILSNGFSEYMGFTESGEKVLMDTSVSLNLDRQDQMTMGSVTKIMAMMSTGDLDVMIMPEEIYEHYAKNGSFQSWETLLSKEDYRKYEEFMTMSTIEEDTKEQAYGIRIEDSKILKESGIVGFTPVVLSVVRNSERNDVVEKFLEYLMK